MQRSTKIILAVSIAVLVSEIGLVWNTWRTDTRRIEHALRERGETLREGFAVARTTSELQLGAIARFIADMDDVQRHLAAGETVVQVEDQEQAEAIRQNLLNQIGRRWHNQQFTLLLRSLGFYLADGTAFLRVEQPYHHSDNAALHSAMIRTVATHHRAVSGFEIGHWATGLYAIAPVHETDADGNRRFLGMVEVGTSLDLMLTPVCPAADCGLAVLLERGAVAALPAIVRDTRFRPDRVAGPWLMEASTNPALTRHFAADIPALEETATTTRLVRGEGGRWFGLTTFPLKDFAANLDDNPPPVGLVMAWQDATAQVVAAQADLRDTVVFATLAFLLVEILLVLSVRLATRRLEQEIATATTEAHSLLEQVSQMAERDPLTDLYNRRAFDTRMAEILAMTARAELPLSLAVIDLDHFKIINDTYGHCAGDHVIARIAGLLHEVARTSDVACRWGGEEFVLVLPATADRQALVMLERLRGRLAESNQVKDGETPPFTFSAGIAQWQRGDDLDSLLKRADRALYRAKHLGRDRIEITAPAEAVA